MPSAPSSIALPADTTRFLLRLSPEILLKSQQVRRQFQETLRRNLRTILTREGVEHTMRHYHGRMMLDVPKAMRARTRDLLPKVFGLGSFSVIDAQVDNTMEAITSTMVSLYADAIRGKRFAVLAKRIGPRVISTREVQYIGGGMLKDLTGATVDLDHPEVLVRVDITEEGTYLFCDRVEGAGGLPAGTQGKVVSLVSGGFDSMVASWQMMRRGARMDFVLCNLAGASAERMVLQAVKVLCTLWGGGLQPRFHVVDFQPLLADIRTHQKQSYWQITLKRLMYRVAEGVAADIHAGAIVTGEALGQVSSQTLANLVTIDAATSLPVLRPLIGMDKKDIMTQARYIGTAPISEHVPEYCGITPTKPATTSTVERVAQGEVGMDPALVDAAVRDRRIIDVNTVTAADLRTPYLWADSLPEDARLIDCQPPEFYRHWHAPGALHYTVEDLKRLYKEVPKDGTYILYCHRGVLSAVMAEHMQQRGYAAYAYRGGLTSLRTELGLDDLEF